MKEQLKKRMDDVLKELKSVISDIEAEGLQNEQETLNFVDEINALSVTF